MDIYKMSSFSKNEIGGNKAGVVLDADSLDEASMMQIANQVGYSETAFVMKSDMADFKVRFFTPVKEVDLCGHATIAVFNLLKQLNIIKAGIYHQETKAGVLEVKVNDENVYMEQNQPVFYEIISKDHMKHCFNNFMMDYICELPIQVVSTGIKDIMLPIKSLEILLSLEPNLELIKKISDEFNVTGIHAFSLDTYDNNSAHCRNFAPLYGINEESATGTSNGALACYLYKYNNKVNKFTFEQGYVMNEPSEINVEFNLKDNNIERVYVGGKAVRI
ncbi:phenazine biosynthesis protein PhzF [Vallitalea longa]|uniref:Phenazine biosynthesis protein PhzF n=1 Tax=Vallitalea longa TaxID=2936439 RepID=A0A9W5YGR7_9FIRM|nr:PhzF family phenazine biosynthesis protein [Vallitalea longa]GKX31644.1 phenazine biosynthesis protein PhzF [Vallitalea longa]